LVIETLYMSVMVLMICMVVLKIRNQDKIIVKNYPLSILILLKKEILIESIEEQIVLIVLMLILIIIIIQN